MTKVFEATTFDVTAEGGVAHLVLNRPDAFNSMTEAFWGELPAFFESVNERPDIRAVVVSALGKHFTSGLDLGWAGGALGSAHADAGRAREKFLRHIRWMQRTFTAVDQCRVPVIAAIQGGCIGGGVDFVTACDLRLGTADCFFTIHEVNIAIVADVGTLQRIPHLLPQGLVRELAYTGRRWKAAEAERQGFLNRVLPDAQSCTAAALELAHEIAAKSPLVIAGIKQVLNRGRDQGIAEGLEQVALWNAAMLQGEDVGRAVAAQMAKKTADYADLAG